jgi:mono/diheme cytochrome c family protein
MPRAIYTAFALLLAACQGQTSTEPPIVPIRNMHELARYDAQERSHYFDDERTMRPPVEGTVAREMEADPVMSTGLEADGRYVATVPAVLATELGGWDALLARGRDRYTIYCVPCHSGVGDGNGLVPTSVPSVAQIRPPTFHDDRLRTVPDGQIFATISNGIRNMPAYNAQIPVRDRWAIVAYVRALQLARSSEQHR